MTDLQIFTYEQQSVRTVNINGVPHFVLKDVCEVLGLTNPTVVAERLDDDERAKFNLGGLSGESNVITESGLYSVILRSDKPKARHFRRWVTGEVLPSIRKHGVFATDELLNNPDLLIDALQALKAERTERERLQLKVTTDKPKVLFADAVSVSKTSLLVGELAKLLRQNGIKTGQNRFFKWLRDNGYLIKRSGSDYNMPTQYSMELGLFEVKETTITHADGHITVSKTPKITGKGQIYFLNKLNKWEHIGVDNRL